MPMLPARESRCQGGALPSLVSLPQLVMRVPTHWPDTVAGRVPAGVDRVDVDDDPGQRGDLAGDRPSPSLKVAVEDRAHDRRPCGGAVAASLPVGAESLENSITDVHIDVHVK